MRIHHLTLARDQSTHEGPGASHCAKSLCVFLCSVWIDSTSCDDLFGAVFLQGYPCGLGRLQPCTSHIGSMALSAEHLQFPRRVDFRGFHRGLATPTAHTPRTHLGKTLPGIVNRITYERSYV